MIWNIVENLTDDEFEQSFGTNSGSIKVRYIHLAEDTWEWFHDWCYNELEMPAFCDMSRHELYQSIIGYIEEWKQLVDHPTIDTYTEQRNGKTVTVNFDEIIFHLVNHHSYHRGQIVLCLRLLGKEVCMTDYVPYKFAS